MKRTTLDRLLADREAKRPVVLVTDLESGAELLLRPLARDEPGSGSRALDDAAREALRADRSTVVEDGGRRLFLHVFNPPLRMIVVGAVHIAQPLARMAALTGYDVTVVDPRTAFATGERFPGVTLITEWPDDALGTLRPDARTAIVTLTHDPKLDDPALEVALRSDAFYVGSLGSRKTHAARCERLRRAGFDEAALGRIHGPVGLGIGARSPAEIAVAILAQVTQVLRTAEPARDEVRAHAG